MDVVSKAEAEAYASAQLGNRMPTEGVPAQTIIDVSRRLASHTGRTDWGESTSRTEYHDGGSRFILVKVWPITTITSVHDDTDHLWPASTLIESASLYASNQEDGVIFIENSVTVRGYQNVQVIYIGGYNGVANVPALVKLAGNMQIMHEIDKNTPGKFPEIIGNFLLPETQRIEAEGLLPEVRSLLKDFIRTVPFA